MPHLNIEVLISQLEKTASNLYNIYVDEKDFSIADRLLAEYDRIKYMIQQLYTVM